MKESTRETVLNILSDIRPDLDFTTETGLITKGILESFDLLTLIASLEDEIGMEIGNRDVNAENFESLDAMVRLVERLTEA